VQGRGGGVDGVGGEVGAEVEALWMVTLAGCFWWQGWGGGTYEDQRKWL
jgi:hypothetical protein